MTQAERILAHRYAAAFITVCGPRIDFDNFLLIKGAAEYFKQHKKVMFFLSLPSLRAEQKKDILYSLFKKLNLPSCFDDLLNLLVNSKRAQLFGHVLEYIVSLYLEKHGIMEFDIESSSSLGADQLKALQQFLAQRTGKDIIYKYRENKNLIAGIRMQSDTYLWEYSVRKKLRTISLSLMR